jgi:hypothetical protein
MSAPTPPLPTPSHGYEFTKNENEVIYRLARSQRGLGHILAGLGAVVLVGGLVFGYAFFQKIKPVPGQSEADRSTQVWGAMKYPFVPALLLVGAGLVLIPLGWWNLSSSRAFLRIVDTTGQDIPNLLVALAALNRAYRLTFLLISVPAAVAVVLLLVYAFDLFQ